MRVALITNSFSRTGGVGKYVLTLADAFYRAGHTPIVAHNDASSMDAGQSYPCKRIPDFDDYEGRAQKETTRTAMDFLRAQKPDVVHVQSSMNYALEAEIRVEFPAVKSLHVYDFCPSGTKFHYASQKTCVHKPGLMCVPRMVYKRCSLDKNPSTLWMFFRRAKDAHNNDIQYPKMIVASEYVREQVLQAGYQDFQVEVVPYFTSIPQEELPHSEKREKILMATGRMVSEKGFDKLLEAVSLIKNVPGWKIIFDGDGGQLENLKKKARKLGLGHLAEFPGWLAARDHQELYRKAFAVIVPSIWPEPFGLVGIEAMSYAKPVIAFQSGGISDWLEDGKNGYLVPSGNIRLLSEKILYLLNQPEKAREMGHRGFLKASESYREDIHLHRLLAIYTGVRANFRKESIREAV